MNGCGHAGVNFNSGVPMERTYLQWNVVNWITVVLMAAIGMLAIGFVSSGLRGFKPKTRE
jgi:hypothetical protein